MENKKTLTLLFLVGIIISGSGASLLAVSGVTYNNTHGLVQYAEFWVVSRAGGGLETGNYSYDYIKYLPFTGHPGDLRVWNLYFNISASQPTDFDSMMQFIAALSAPNTAGYFETSWWRHVRDTMSNQASHELLLQGLATPHNITVYYVEAVLRIFANNTVYTFSLGRNPYVSQTEVNGTKSGGLVYMRLWFFDYNPDGTFTYRVPDLNDTVLNLGFNSDGNFSFSLLVEWSVFFEQEYGLGLNYAGNTTIANWLFRKLDADTIGVSIDLINTNYYDPPVPAFTVIPWMPAIETGIVATGLTVIVIGLALRRKYCSPNASPRSVEDAHPESQS